jgi:hypothetical protein
VIYSIIGGILQLTSMCLLFVTAFSDPGIMPRQKEFTEHYDQRTKSFRVKQPIRVYELVLRGHPFRLKYCTTCNIYRPPRCTHCSVCDNCVERFDHHCPWIGNCVGVRNYAYFFSFVTVTGTLNFFVFATALMHVVTRCLEIQEAATLLDQGLGGGQALLRAMGDAPASTALAIYGLLIVWFTVGLCLYHSYLICTNQTTYEQFKGLYSATANPFHRGVVGNCHDILFARIRPRYFNAHTLQLLWPKSGADARTVKVELPGKSEGNDPEPEAKSDEGSNLKASKLGTL